MIHGHTHNKENGSWRVMTEELQTKDKGEGVPDERAEGILLTGWPKTVTCIPSFVFPIT